MKQSIFITVFLLIAALLPPTGANGQTPFFRTHSLGEAFHDAGVNFIYEASDGFLWFGADKGLFRYDGLSFKQYLAPDSLTVNAVSAIFEDSRGLFWVGYKDGAIAHLNQYRKLTGWQVEEGLPKVPITAFAEDSKGVIWFSTYGEGIYYYQNNRLYNFNTDDGLPGNDIYTIVRDRHDRIWAATDGGISICTLAGGKKKVENITRADGLPDEIVRTLLPDEQGNLWIGTYDEGICYLDVENRKITQILSEWSSGVVNNLELFQNRELWIGTEGNGLWRYDLKNRKLTQINEEGKLAGAKIYDLHKDVEGNIWVLSNSAGIISANRQFEAINPRLPDIQSVLVDSRNRLWVGAQNGLFSFLADQNGSGVFNQHFPDLELNVLSLYEDKYGNIWAGTFGDGVYCFNPTAGSFRHIEEKDGLTNGSVLSIDGINGHIWLATLGGVTEITCRGSIFEPESLSFKNLSKENGLGANFIYKVFIDSKGRTWFGTDGDGIGMLENGRITNFKQAGDIPLKAVYSITEDRRGHIWMSTAREGIFEFDGARFSHLTLKEGIRDLAITSLATDDKGNILIVHPSGIDLLDPVTKHLIYYDVEVGIENIDPNLNAVCSDRQGNIWIGAQNRILRYTALDEELSIHPRTQITGLSIFLDPVDFRSRSIFSHDQNNLIIEYVGLWYSGPEKVKYRYKLEGFDRDWIISRDRQTIYSNLPPGKYTFRICSTENDAFDMEPVESYSFTIKAPFWKQLWFILAGIATVVGLTLWFIKAREERLQREALLKKEKVESQFEALKSQINPHFLFNSFNTLITIIEENPKVAVEYVENLSDFYRSILQYREQEVIALNEEIELVRHYEFLLKKRYGDNLQVRIGHVNGASVFIAPLTLQVLVENAIKHNVISKTKPLIIDIALENGEYIAVSNNLQKKITPAQSTGFGLHSISNRYALLSEKKVKIEETSDRFKVSIPIIKNSKE